ncbi:MAG: hypothetical protein ALMCE001_14970 [Methanocorpusculum sp. MCE]|nr:MAG: hypothetical protein ALMCE001_14970 [Methanocorpusculum sp. MCE]
MKKDVGVSEVVGIMLMLVVVLVIVSVVASSVSGLASVDNTPVSAEMVVVEYNGTDLIFENVAGDAFPLKRMKLVMGVRDNVQKRWVFYATNMTSTRETTVMVGDRISVSSPDFAVAAGEYLTYQFYDTDAGVLVSSGEILM